MDVQLKADIYVELSIMTEVMFDKYLGPPAMVGVDRSDSFVHLLERNITRLKSWKKKFLSMDGKKILLKEVIQSIHVFAMSVFNISKKEICDAIARYCWGSS